MISIYEYINNKITLETDPSCFYSFFNLKDVNDEIEEKDLYQIFNKISQIIININHNYNTVFYTWFITTTGKSTFKLEDINNEDMSILETIDLEKLPINLRAFTAHIIWEKQNKNHKKYLDYAYNSYIELFKTIINDEKLSVIFKRNYIIFALNLAKTSNNKTYIDSALNIIEQVVLSSETDIYLVLELLPLLGINKYGDYKKVYNNLSNIKPTSDSFKIKLLEGKINFLTYFKADDLIINAVKELVKELIEKYEQFKDTNVIVACELISKVYSLNQKFKLNEIDNQDIITKMHDCYKAINNQFIEMKIEIKNPIFGYLYTNTLNLYNELNTFEESLIAITYLIKFIRIEMIKNEIISNPCLCDFLMNKKVIDSNNNIPTIIKPLNFNEMDKEVINKHISQRILLKQIICSGILFNLITILKNKFNKKENNKFDFLIENNSLIPNNRKQIIKTGFNMFFEGMVYESIHILIPQFENMLRYMLQINNVNDLVIKDDFSEKVKLLWSTLTLLKDNKILPEDVIFHLNSLLNDPSGANIRNRVCHGIMNPEDGVDSICVYFVCVFLKFLVLNSDECEKIFLSSQQLRIFKSYINDPLKIFNT